MSFASETAKVRDRVLPFLNGPRGLDLGVHAEKITPTAVGVDRNPAAPAVNVILDVTLPLPWSDGYFDWVFSSHCLEHLPQPPAAILPEWWRVVRRGGVLALYLPHKNLYRSTTPSTIMSSAPNRSWLSWASSRVRSWFTRKPKTDVTPSSTHSWSWPGKRNGTVATHDTPIELALEGAFRRRSNLHRPVYVPLWVKQHPVGPYRADFAFVEEQLCVEADGEFWHGRPDARLKDIERDRYFADRGWVVLRFLGRQCLKDPDRCAALVEATLHALRVRRRPAPAADAPAPSA